MPKIWSVSELTAEIGRALSERAEFRNCWVSGEISNYKNHRPSGHWYFTLKDEDSSLRAVMFRSRAERVRFEPRSGLQVVVRGDLRLYDRDGNIQLYVSDMQPSGIGELYLAFEQLKERLGREGLFDPARKKAVPLLPRRLGIVTSPSGAALRDILNIGRRRHPKMSWLLAPAAVQGETAPREVALAIERLNRYGGLDVIIVGRGGGSLEELWAFNSEEVARAIAASRIPVISAVGHETDVTIADYAADLRAPTPSAAAELAVPLLADLKNRIGSALAALLKNMKAQLAWKRRELEYFALKAPLKDPFWRSERSRQELDTLFEALSENMARFITDKNGILQILGTRLDLLSPLAILNRGYSLTYGEDGRLVRSAEEVDCEDVLRVRLASGSLQCRVLTKDIGGTSVS
ncbi:exodeoxyribonuclease VII [Acididesulfobacillus acetoxydans]|uniref:Exodeoxyribonuclease 7 large subunit n=1 Tax=Acididesulfobacillus acetoxydans TaxID=1561005 RepID=A0A8S0W3Z2_9FIRM|nr:exodeoxyribonuclease VII large subunit [Acididesulfobacillus acetoxydans]CAA7602118.1 exodeoxyribonuclease VII [Acididesulfobacillus acetoxydans]CEJ08039.1 Exodeoxyribonuclease 7 large subunit [Acididesulfobacillus acetoxydans]